MLMSSMHVSNLAYLVCGHFRISYVLFIAIDRAHDAAIILIEDMLLCTFWIFGEVVHSWGVLAVREPSFLDILYVLLFA